MPSFRSARFHFATKSERKWNADRRCSQTAVLLARPRFQQEAHAYRRPTAALARGRSPPQGSAPGHVSWDLGLAPLCHIPIPGAETDTVFAGVTRRHLSQSSEHLAPQSFVLGG